MKTILSAFCLLAVSLFWIGCASTNPPTPEMTLMSDSDEGAAGAEAGFDTAEGADLPGDFEAEGTLPARDEALTAQGEDMPAYSSVYFDFDRSYVRESERPTVEETATYLLGNPGQKVLVEGHCDWRGTTEYNLALGDRRSNSVKDYLVELGVPAMSIEILSKGDLEADENADEMGRQNDRRADIILLP